MNKPEMPKYEAHPANVAGDFYVENHCCTMCDVPFIWAPELFGIHVDPKKGYEHCYVKQQPHTPEQHEQMFSAILCAELECIRYRGSDSLIVDKLIEAGDGLQCDNLTDDLRRRAEQVKEERRLESRAQSSLWWRLVSWWRKRRE